uniref:Uncharacterized protein n=1 Tax=Arundo donax TaxID=35708 RepID=A0A0A9EFB3_ARUDO
MELSLICAAPFKHKGFILSHVLSDTTAVHNLTLSFQGEKVNPCFHHFMHC